MQASVTRRPWAAFRARAALVGYIWGAAACSGDAEVTTELLDGPESDRPSPSLGSSMASSGSSGSSGSTGSASGEAARPDRGSPTGGSSPAVAPGGDGAGPLVSLASLDVPGGEHCAAVSAWDPEWVQFEEEVLLMVNEERAQPADCGKDGKFAAAAPVVMDPILRCSARLHSLDMFTRAFFAHTNPDGLDPFDRMAAANFRGSGAGENIAVGQTSPQQVMKSWMDSDDHCSNVMRASYTMLGVGYHPGAGARGLGSHFWTQNFGAPPAARACTRNCR